MRPDIPPQWLYRTAEARAAGATMRNEPAELPRIGAALAGAARRSRSTRSPRRPRANAIASLPRLAGLMSGAAR